MPLYGKFDHVVSFTVAPYATDDGDWFGLQLISPANGVSAVRPGTQSTLSVNNDKEDLGLDSLRLCKAVKEYLVKRDYSGRILVQLMWTEGEKWRGESDNFFWIDA